MDANEKSFWIETELGQIQVHTLDCKDSFEDLADIIANLLLENESCLRQD